MFDAEKLRLSDNHGVSAQSFGLCFRKIGLCFGKLMCFGKLIFALRNWFVFLRKMFCVLVN